MSTKAKALVADYPTAKRVAARRAAAEICKGFVEAGGTEVQLDVIASIIEREMETAAKAPAIRVCRFCGEVLDSALREDASHCVKCQEPPA